MSKLIIFSIVILLLCKYSECCDLLKYKYSPTDKIELYEKLESRKTCNGMPIYKMVDDLFFIYKLAKSNYWCNSYIPSKIVICQAECDEIRFDFNDVFSRQGAIPQEYMSSLWISLPNHSIVCNDEEYFDDVVVYDDLITQPAVELNDTLVFNTTSVVKNKTHEMLLDEALLNVQTIQNNQTNPSNKTEKELQEELIKSENEYIILKLLETTEEMRMKVIRDNLFNQIPQESTTVATTTSTSTNPSTSTIEALTTTTLSNEKDIEDEDKYILSMVLEFSDFDKRNAKPTEKKD